LNGESVNINSAFILDFKFDLVLLLMQKQIKHELILAGFLH